MKFMMFTNCKFQRAQQIRLWATGCFFVITALFCICVPEITVAELAEFRPQAPGCSLNLLFGSYQGKNLLYVVTKATRLTLYVSFVALLLSIACSIFLIFLDFYAPTHRFIHKLLSFTVYVPRLFCLIILIALLELYQPSQLSMSIFVYLIILLGGTGAIFLASQTSQEIATLRRQLFVRFAFSLQLSTYFIFWHHILRNCTLLPIIITKQLRDNVLFLSSLSFIGLIHIQPEDLGGLICKYYSTPDVYFQGWWILFFPCAMLCWLILLCDQLAHHIAIRIEKSPIVDKM